MITIRSKGDFSKTKRYLDKLRRAIQLGIFDKYGREGVAALASATPVETGETANSWHYEVTRSSTGVSLIFTNTHINKGVNIAIILQYGHGTGTGGWVEGRDYINPSIRPVFDKLSENLWREVTKL